MTPDMITYATAGLAFIAIVGLGFAFAGGGRGKQARRMKDISDGARTRGSVGEHPPRFGQVFGALDE